MGNVFAEIPPLSYRTVIEIRDTELQAELNRLRKDVVENLSTLLSADNIDPISIREY
jgi:hypothetical protein